MREALNLRIKDTQFEYGQLIVRSGKGRKDHSAILADALVAPPVAPSLEQGLDEE